MIEHKGLMNDSKQAENNKFVLSILNKVKSGKLSPEHALISINTLIVSVDRNGRGEIRDIMNDAFGNALLDLSIGYLANNRPSVAEEFREFLFDRATKAPSQKEIIAEMDEANERIIANEQEKTINERVRR